MNAEFWNQLRDDGGLSDGISGRRIVRIAPEMLWHLLMMPSQGIEFENEVGRQRLTIVTDIPKNVVPLRCSIDHNGDVAMLIQSEDFQPASENLPIEDLTITYRLEVLK